MTRPFYFYRLPCYSGLPAGRFDDLHDLAQWLDLFDGSGDDRLTSLMIHGVEVVFRNGNPVGTMDVPATTTLRVVLDAKRHPPAPAYWHEINEERA